MNRSTFWIIFSAVAILATAQSRAEMMPTWIIESSDLTETIVSTNPTERDQLVKDGWKIDATGQMRTAWIDGAGPLHRLFRSTSTGTDRILETDVGQLPALQKAGYVDEGVVGFVADSDGTHRLAVIQFSKGSRRLWVVSEAAQVTLAKDGWTRQGVHFWLWSMTE